MHVKGFGFVSPKDSKKYPKDVFIPKHRTSNAVDGDTVLVAIRSQGDEKRGPDGYVIKIVERAKKELVATVWMVDPRGNYILYSPLLGRMKLALVEREKGVQYEIGDRLALFVEDWREEGDPALCRVLEKIGSIGDPKVDIPAAIREFQIRHTFPKGVLGEIASLPRKVGKEELEGRLDLTHLEAFTIDPDRAEDFDDALSLKRDAEGNYHLGVHIADVAHYVPFGSELDREAKRRSHSVYFPNRCVPMLPEILSNHLCSLREKSVRLTVSLLIEFDEEGDVVRYRICRAFIKSRKRFTYGEARAVLDGEKKSPHGKSLQLMKQLSLLLKKKRVSRGSVDLALPELVLLIDEMERPYGYRIEEYDISHQLVEEFMLKANELVAEHFIERRGSTLFRVHELPFQENLDEFYALARSLGFSLPTRPKNRDIQRLFDRAKGSPYAYHLSVAFIRSMKLAIYSRDNVGHYGLALPHYCHFTSPIRRYVDLVIHRLLFSPSLLDNALLEEIARECSERERLSFKAELSVIKLKKLRLLNQYHRENPKGVYDAIVHKVKPFGIFFEVLPLSIDGFIHVSSLREDEYTYHPKIQGLVGNRSGRFYRVGDGLQLHLDGIDFIYLESTWRILKKKVRE